MLTQGKCWYLSAVFDPLQNDGEVGPVFRLMLPALGHYPVSKRRTSTFIKIRRNKDGKSIFSPSIFLTGMGWVVRSRRLATHLGARCLASAALC